jgi:acyl-CoA thioester hydrolase
MRVRFRDTDAQGHVYFGNYFEFCDEALSAYMRALGMPWQELLKRGTDLFYASATCDYLGSARFEDLVHVEAQIVKIGTTSITSEFTVRGDDGQTLAKARLVSVCVDSSTRQKTRVPDEFRDALAAFEGV